LACESEWLFKTIKKWRKKKSFAFFLMCYLKFFGAKNYFPIFKKNVSLFCTFFVNDFLPNFSPVIASKISLSSGIEKVILRVSLLGISVGVRLIYLPLE